jgi:hypothetical protein
MQLLKQSSTAKALVFFLYDSSDHVTGKAGVTPTVTISKNGGSFASPSGSVTEIANGFYKVAGNATDTNTLGALALYATGTGCDPCAMAYNVVALDPDLAAAGALMPTTAGRTLVVDASGLADANVVKMGPTGSGTAQTARDIGASVLLSSGTGTGQVLLSSGKVSVPDTQKVDVETIKTQAVTCGAGVTVMASVGTAATSTAQTGDNYARLGAPAGASHAADVAAIHAKTTNLPSDPADQSLIITATDAILTAVGDVPTNAELATALGTADDAVLAQVALVKAVTDKLDDTLEDSGGGAHIFTVASLANAPAGGGGGTTDWTANERTAIRTILGVPASGTTPDAPSAGALKVIDDLIDTELAAVKTVVDAVQAKTDNLPTDPADASVLAALIDTVDNFVDTEVAAIKTGVDALTAANGVEAGISLLQAQKAILSAMAGIATGGNTDTIVLKNPAGDTTRISMTVDADGNRSAVTLNV